MAQGLPGGSPTSTSAGRPSSIGSAHTCATRADTTLWCWGNGANDRLGSGGTATRTTPRQVGTTTTWRTVGSGSDYTCGTQTGPSGLGTTADQTTPQRLSLLGRPVEAGSSSFTTVLVTPVP